MQLQVFPDFAIGEIDPSTGESIEAKARDIALNHDEVWYMRYPGGGWGDSLDRDPKLVVQDVNLRTVSAESALSVYGVALRHDPPGYDEAATVRQRETIRAQRLAGGRSADGHAVRRSTLADALATHGASLLPADHRIL